MSSVVLLLGATLSAAPNITKIWEANENSRDGLQDLGKYSADDVCEGRGKNCQVLLDVPDECAGSASSTCGIAVCLHGNKGAAEQGRDICGEEIHGRGKYIGVYPQGDPVDPGEVGGQWNDGQVHYDPHAPTLLKCEYDDFNCKKDPDDGDFIAKTVAAVQHAGVMGKLFVVGESRGAIMAQRVAASAGRKLPVVAVAGHAASMFEPARSGPGQLNYNIPTSATPRVAYFWVHPEDDAYCNVDGGPKFKSEDTFRWKSANEAAATWAVHNGCTNSTHSATSSWHLSPTSGSAKKAKKVGAMTEPGRVSEQIGTQGKAVTFTFNGCPSTAPVSYIRAEKGTHEMWKVIGSKTWQSMAFDMFEHVSRSMATWAD